MLTPAQSCFLCAHSMTHLDFGLVGLLVGLGFKTARS